MPLGTDLGLGAGDIVLWDPAPSPYKGTQPPLLGPCLLWPNGWMDQDASWYEGRLLGSGPIVLNGDPAVPLFLGGGS